MKIHSAYNDELHICELCRCQDQLKLHAMASGTKMSPVSLQRNFPKFLIWKNS